MENMPPAEPLGQTQSEDAPLTSETPTVNTKNSTSKKGLLVSLVIVVVVACVVGVLFALTKKSKNEPAPTVSSEVQKSKETVSDTSDQLAPVANIAKELAQYKVATADIDDPKAVNEMAYFFEGTESFSMTNGKTFDVYQFESDSAYEVTEDICSIFAKKYDLFVANAKKHFTNDGFTATDVKLYVQYRDCGKAFIATKNEDTCFVRYFIEMDVANKKMLPLAMLKATLVCVLYAVNLVT